MPSRVPNLPPDKKACELRGIVYHGVNRFVLHADVLVLPDFCSLVYVTACVEFRTPEHDAIGIYSMTFKDRPLILNSAFLIWICDLST